MPNALAEATLNAGPDRPVLRRATALLIATDGTAQSDAAITLARLLPLRGQGEVKVLTVVDQASIPWGTVEPSLVIDYERGLHQDARSWATRRARELISSPSRRVGVVE